MTDEINTKPFDRSELSNCYDCGKGMMHAGDIHFYEVTVTQCIVDTRAVQQQHGLEMMLGAAAPLAAVLAPTTTVAHRISGKRRLFCAQCGMKEHNVAIMLEGD